MKLRLTDRDVSILRDTARLQLLSTKQQHQLNFTQSTFRAAANRLRQLKAAGFIKSVYAPLTSEETQNPTRPSSIWFFPPDCQKRVASQLVKQNRVDDLLTIEDELRTFNKSQKFAQQSLIHETSISDIIISTEESAKTLRDFQHIFTIRTSPRYEGISKKITVSRTKTIKQKGRGAVSRNVKQTQTVNPDYFQAFKKGRAKFSFVFGEFDNDSSRPDVFFEKMEGYAAYLKQGHFSAVVSMFSERYALGIVDPQKASFRVCVVVGSSKSESARMNRLIEFCLRLPYETFFNFTTLEEYKKDPFGAIWYNKAVFRQVEDEYADKIINASPTIRRKWFSETIPTLSPQALLNS